MVSLRTCLWILLSWSFWAPPAVVCAAAYDPRTVAQTYPETHSPTPLISLDDSSLSSSTRLPRGGGLLAGYNPFGYKITTLGQAFLEFGGSLDSDVGRLLASLKDRKTTATIKTAWLEIVRVSKKSQSMRIYRNLEELIDFCLKSGLID